MHERTLRAMRTRTILLASLMLLVSISPMVSAFHDDFDLSNLDSNEMEIEAFGPDDLEKPFELISLDERPTLVSSSSTSGRAPCPAIQNDGGTAGDAGNETATAKSIGTDPTTTFQGCVDSTDRRDWYEIQISQGYNVDIVLTFTAQNYNLGIHNGTHWVDTSVNGNNVYEERVSTVGTRYDSVGGTFYISAEQSSGDGNYDIETWANKSVNCTEWGSQDDANTGGDAPEHYTMNPTNMGSNVTATYTGCLDEDDKYDVFAFDVPSDHMIEASLNYDEPSNDYDLYLLDSNGTQVDSSTRYSGTESVSTSDTSEEAIGGTYYINVSAYSGKGNYTLDIWTNYSVPLPEFELEQLDSSGNTNLGESYFVNLTINNTGRLNATDTFDVEVYLSTDTILSKFDHLIGSSTVAGIDIGVAASVPIQGTIPTNIVQGTYNLIVALDTSDVILELDEDNNEVLRSSQITVGTVVTSCPGQNDAKSSTDAGDASSTLVDLGQAADVEFRGCMDENDRRDNYRITVPAGENLNITLVNPPDGDIWGDLVWDGNNTSIDNSFELGGDEYLSTWDTEFNGTGGTFTLMLNWTDVRIGFFGRYTGGAGDYRIIIGEPDEEYVVPFSCAGFSDAGTGTDAGTDMDDPIPIGENPTLDGQGCLSGQDTSDAYQFRLSDYNNVRVMFQPDSGTNFTANLYDAEGNMVPGWNGTEWTSINDMAHEGQNEEYFLVVDSTNSNGYYNVSINTLDPVDSDLAVSNLSCGMDMISNEELFYSFEISNLRGPTLGEFEWALELVDNDGILVELLDSSVESTNATYGENVLTRSSSKFIDSNITSGIYSCIVMVNIDQVFEEIEIENNILRGDNFSIQNEEELWANDADRDGYNTTDTGDSIVDACPDKYGESWGDRYGCADLDGDGWSNSNDFDPFDETQWVDEDGDEFGDNSSGTFGDQCPGVPGVENGDGGDGCPEFFIDTDGDGVQDSDDDCDATPTGATVDENGCEVDTDGDGVADSIDNCQETTPGVNVDDNGCEIIDGSGGADNNDDGSDNNEGAGSEDSEEESTEDSSESGSNAMMIGGIGFGVVIIILLTLLVVKKGRGENEFTGDSYANAVFDHQMEGMAEISSEQLAYEQQLIAHGYPPEQARAYADQYFRPNLNQ